MALKIEIPIWQVLRHCKGNIYCWIGPLTKEDHFWYNVEVFKMREAWKKLPSDNWMLHHYHNESNYAYFDLFEHRRDALRALGVKCREYMLHAQARYEKFARAIFIPISGEK